MKCSACGSILSYNDKACTRCGAPPEQDYEHNKDRTITTLLDVVKSIFIGSPSLSIPKQKREMFDFNNPPQQYCLGCGQPMIMKRAIDGYNHDGSPQNCYECCCPETKKPFLFKLFNYGSHYRWRLFLKPSGWDTVSYAEDW